MCQGFSDFSGLLHHFVLVKLVPSSIWVNKKNCVTILVRIFSLIGIFEVEKGMKTQQLQLSDILC